MMEKVKSFKKEQILPALNKCLVGDHQLFI